MYDRRSNSGACMRVQRFIVLHVPGVKCEGLLYRTFLAQSAKERSYHTFVAQSAKERSYRMFVVQSAKERLYCTFLAQGAKVSYQNLKKDRIVRVCVFCVLHT